MDLFPLSPNSASVTASVLSSNSPMKDNTGVQRFKVFPYPSER